MGHHQVIKSPTKALKGTQKVVIFSTSLLPSLLPIAGSGCLAEGRECFASGVSQGSCCSGLQCQPTDGAVCQAAAGIL